ncbi:hypothetical protein [Pontibacter akesuensis]|uniref:Uncharacterized protein n=1 Tax=Pontibacter akesuensis TaxID=388950 RepID=A0A1I7J157_9BACT|nr:hypothetical protein [Pontibacter akesuensis]GHA73072.1 hypothetical protein GCM10007389_28690 [Pontibacter akesuensis]SFU78913.1 hypothetical protein SAMN04487941_2393 [Pontibacter akesuensis]
MQPEAELKKYYDLTKRMDAQGGPEGSTNLFEEILWQEQQILSFFGLPNSDKYRKILWELTYDEKFGKKAVQNIVKQLQEAAETHLLAPVHTALEMLNQAQREKSSAFDILPELGFATHIYTLYVYEQLLLKGEITTEEALAALQKTAEPAILDKLGVMANKEQPRRTKSYRELKEEIPYIEGFIDHVLYAEEEMEEDEEEEITVEGDEFEPVPFLLGHPAVVERIICIEHTNISMVVRANNEDKPEMYTLGMHVDEFKELMSLYEPLGAIILARGEQLTAENGTEEPVIYEIDLEEDLGQTLEIDQHYLEVYAPQIRDERGRLEENRFGFVMLHEIIPIGEVEEIELQDEEAALNQVTGQLKHIQAWYGFYLNKLKSLNKVTSESLSAEEKQLIARHYAGLQDDSLFELARQLHELYSRHHINFELRNKSEE